MCRTKWKMSILLLSICLLCACNSGKSDYREEELSKVQIESLCEQYAELDDSYEDIVPSKAMAAIKVFGIEKDGDIGYVYCYTSEGTYVKVNNKAYNISGAIGPNILKIKFNGEDVQLIDSDDSPSSTDVLSRFPKKYRKIAKDYETNEAYDFQKGFFRVQLEEAEKIEKIWNVEVDLAYCIDIYPNGEYEVWDFPEDEKVIIESGRIDHEE